MIPRDPRARAFGLLALGLLGTLTGGCARQEPAAAPEATASPEPWVAEFVAMGTSASVAIAGEDDATAAAAGAAVERLMQRYGGEWYPWNPDGELAHLNRALAAGRRTEVSAELADLLVRSRTLSAAAGGSFDPGVGRLVELWGFRTGTRPEGLPLPQEAALAAWRADHPGIGDLDVTGREVGSARRDLLVDLGAIGKGRVVDLAACLLAERGIANALLTAGGNIRAIGRRGERGWRVAVQDPRRDTVLGWVELDDGESIDTSGDYERYAMVDGQRIHHLFDPRTALPPDHTEAVTVIARDSTTADAAETALFIAGPGHWPAVAARLGVVEVLRIDRDGRIEITPRMAERFHFLPDVEPAHPVTQVALPAADLPL